MLRKIFINISKCNSQDILQDIICKFYEYDYKNFDLNYNGLSYKKDYEKLKKVATSFFLRSSYKYLSKKNFYYRKKIEQYKREFSPDLSSYIENLFYSNINVAHGNIPDYFLNKLSKYTDYVDTLVYLDSFKKFIYRSTKLRKETKHKILLYFYHKNKKIFGSNGDYYKKILVDMNKSFNKRRIHAS